MKESDIVSTMTVLYVSEGAGKVVAASDQVTAALQKEVATHKALEQATETSARRQASAAAALDALARKTDPAARAMAELEKTYKDVTRALSFDQSPKAIDTANKALEVYRQRLVEAEAQQKLFFGTLSSQTLDKQFNIGGGMPAGSARQSAAVFEKAEAEAAAAAQDKMAASALRLRTALNPLEAEQGKLAAEMREYKMALDGGHISQEQFAAGQVLLGKRLGDFAQNLKVAGTAGRVMSGEMTNLGFQLNDVVTGLALGQSPFMIMAQQGGQIVQIFANSRSSIADFASSSLRWLGSLISPMSILATGAIAATAAVAALALQYDKLQVSSQRALIGAGAKTGTTVDDLNKFTEQNSGSLGTNFTTGLSTKEARAFGEELTKTGEIVISRLHGMSDAVVGFANQTGMSMEDARKALVGIAVDPKKGLDELAKTFGAFDNATRQAVEELARADDKTGAFQVMVDAISDKLKTAAENMNVAEKAARGLVNALAISENPTGLEQQLEAQRQRVVAAMDTPTGGLGGGEGAKAAAVEREAKAYEDLNAQLLKKDAITGKAQADKLSSDAEKDVRAIIPEINAIDQLKDKIAELNRAKAAGAVSMQGGAVDASALQMAENQLAALQQSKAEAARYAIEVANISTSWGTVGQSVALQLQTMQNALPVAQAWTEAGKMKAQYEATYLDLLNKGKTAEEASAVASKQQELSKAAAVASAEKLVQASQDNLDMIQAQGTGMEGVVASAIAYRDAIQAGATATQAAAIAANTLAANLARAAQAETQALNGSQFQQLNSVDANGILDVTRAGHSQFDPQVMPKGALTFSAQGGIQTRGMTGWGHVDLGPRVDLLQLEAQQQRDALNFSGTYASGGADAALDAIKNAPNTIGLSGARAGLLGKWAGEAETWLGKETSTISEKMSAYDQIIGLKNSQTTDKGMQANNLQSELAWLQTLPASIARDEKINSLQQSIDQLRNSTDGLNATNSELLSPYYSQDPRTSHIGFRSQGMASGGSFIVPGGYSSNDNVIGQIPLASGEQVSVSRPGDRGSQPINIYQTITVQGSANRDDVGRTMYHNAQTLGRQIRAAS